MMYFDKTNWEKKSGSKIACELKYWLVFLLSRPMAVCVFLRWLKGYPILLDFVVTSLILQEVNSSQLQRQWSKSLIDRVT